MYCILIHCYNMYLDIGYNMCLYIEIKNPTNEYK